MRGLPGLLWNHSPNGLRFVPMPPFCWPIFATERLAATQTTRRAVPRFVTIVSRHQALRGKVRTCWLVITYVHCQVLTGAKPSAPRSGGGLLFCECTRVICDIIRSY